MVVNLAGGLDTRPYRTALAAVLQWIEVDLPCIKGKEEDDLLILDYEPGAGRNPGR